jgi:amino acid transporter
MAKEAYLPRVFGEIDSKYGAPKNAIIFCLIISLSGPILGREALGWFVDMSAIGGSMGFFFTSASAFQKIGTEKDGGTFLKVMAVAGMIFSVLFVILQLVPIPGLNGIHFGKESYFMLIVWVVIGIVFYLAQKKAINNKAGRV